MINKHYFKTWSHNMSYVLGLWFAKGQIAWQKTFLIRLRAKDKYIMKQVAKELGYTRDLFTCDTIQMCQISINSAIMCNDLKKLNMDVIPKKFLPDFIRGHFDGSGYIMEVKGGRINTTFIDRDYQILDKIWQILKEDAGVESGSYDASRYSLKFGKKDSIKIGKYIYQNDPELYLERKKLKFIL